MENNNYAYCLLHSKSVSKQKAFAYCRAGKPYRIGVSYKKTGKGGNDYRCKNLIILEN